MITLAEIKSLVDSLIEKDKLVSNHESLLKMIKEDARKLREEIIPCALQEHGLTKIVLETGEAISLTQEVYASIPEEKKPLAFKWLTEGGFSGLIKIDVITSFKKGEYENAQSLHEDLFSKGLFSKLSQSVHPQTLKAFLKEQIAAGKDIPLELFGACPVFKVTIKK